MQYSITAPTDVPVPPDLVATLTLHLSHPWMVAAAAAMSVHEKHSPHKRSLWNVGYGYWSALIGCCVFWWINSWNCNRIRRYCVANITPCWIPFSRPSPRSTTARFSYNAETTTDQRCCLFSGRSGARDRTEDAKWNEKLAVIMHFESNQFVSGWEGGLVEYMLG